MSLAVDIPRVLDSVATNIVKIIGKQYGVEVPKCVDVYELPNTDGLRYIIVRTLEPEKLKVFITQNLLSWFKFTMLSDTKLKDS